MAYNFDKRHVNIIGIDTSTGFCSVGVCGYSIQPVELSETAATAFNERIFYLLGEALKKAHIEKSAVHAVAICRGPGSFTGIRVGLSAAKGLAHALNVPIIGVTAFDVLEYTVESEYFPLCCVVPARGEKISYVVYEKPGAAHGERTGTPGTWSDICKDLGSVKGICGDIPEDKMQLLPDSLPAAVVFKRKPSGIHVAELGLHKLKDGCQDDLVSLSPVYMHAITFREKAPVKGRK